MEFPQFFVKLCWLLTLVLVSRLWRCCCCLGFASCSKRGFCRRGRISAVYAVGNNNMDNNKPAQQHVDTVIVGAGPAGLLSAIMYAQKFPSHKVRLFERLPNPPPSPSDDEVWKDVARFYLIGLGHRGQNALSKFNVMEAVSSVSTAVVGRKDWSPEADGVERLFTNRSYTTQVLPREKLVGCLHRHITSSPYLSERIQLNYGVEITPISLGDEQSKVIVRATNCDQDSSLNSSQQVVLPSGAEADILCDVENEPIIVSANLLIGADGSARTIANFMESLDESANVKNPILKIFRKRKRFKVTRYVDDNQRVYKTIPIQLPPGWRYDLNYSARTNGSNLNLDALPSNRFGSYCAVLLFKAGDPLAVANCDPGALRKKLDECMPQFSNLIDENTLQMVAKKGPSYLPSFRYAGPRLHQGRAVIIGDCAHTVKPYFGLGANTALEDVSALSDAFDESSSLIEALQLFSKKRAGESKAIVQMSRELDRPGKLGLLTFVLPLVVDSIFHRLAPKLFAPSTLSMFSLEGYDFRTIRARKRLDRAMQLTVICTLLASISRSTTLLIQLLVKAARHGNPVFANSLVPVVSAASLFTLFRRKASRGGRIQKAGEALRQETSEK